MKYKIVFSSLSSQSASKKDSLSTIVIKFVPLIQMFTDEFPVSLTTQILALLMTAYYP